MDAVFRNPVSLPGVLSLSSAVREVRRGMAAPTDGGCGRTLPPVSPRLKMNMRQVLTGVLELMGGIGNRMEPNRLSIRLFGNVVRSPHGDNAEVTEVQVQV